MKSTVNNVIAMTAAVACLGLVLSRPAGADDDKGKKEIKREANVFVIRAEGEEDVSEAVKKALEGQLKDLPPEIRKKIEQHLKSIKVGQVGDLKGEVKVQAIVVGDDGKGKPQAYRVVGPAGVGKQLDLKWVEAAADAKKEASAKKAQALRIAIEKQAEAEVKIKKANERIIDLTKVLEAKANQIAITHGKVDGEKKSIAIAVALDEDEVSAKDGVKQLQVKIVDGKVLLNGKPIADIKGLGSDKAQIRVEVKADEASGAKKQVQRKMMFMGKDGKVQEFELDVDVDVKDVQSHKHDGDDKHQHGAHTIIVRRHKDGEHEDIDVIRHAKPIRITGTGNKTVQGHAVFHVDAHGDDVHADVTQRLKSIEAELKKIRHLLQKMQDEDDDDEDEDDDEDDDDDDDDDDEDDD